MHGSRMTYDKIDNFRNPTYEAEFRYWTTWIGSNMDQKCFS